MITYHILLARRHGAAAAIPLVASFGDRLPVQLAYDEVTGENVARFAAEFAELLYVSDGAVLASHDFPDPASVAEKRQRATLAEARAVRDAARAAEAAISEAKARAAAARSALNSLSPEHHELLKAEDAAQSRAAAGAKAAKATADALAAEEAKARELAAAQAEADGRAAQEQAAADARALNAASRSAGESTGTDPVPPG